MGLLSRSGGSMDGWAHMQGTPGDIHASSLYPSGSSPTRTGRRHLSWHRSCGTPAQPLAPLLALNGIVAFG